MVRNPASLGLPLPLSCALSASAASHCHTGVFSSAHGLTVQLSPVSCALFSLAIKGTQLKQNLETITRGDATYQLKYEKQDLKVCKMDQFAWESIEKCYHFSTMGFRTGTSGEFSGLASDVWQQQLIFIIHGATFLLPKKACV